MTTKKQQQVLEFAKQHNGFITAKQLGEQDLNHAVVTRLVVDELLVKSDRGLYRLPEQKDDFLYGYQVHYASGFFCLSTALYLLGYLEESPELVDMVFPYKSKTSYLPDNINASRELEKFFGIGRITVKTRQGNSVDVYSIERTLCDLVRPGKNVDIKIIGSAFRQYVKTKSVDVKKLLEYAVLLGVEQKVESYLEVLL
ncbi:MAG: type IV toxin-antitoxin system AbiEi family antitoxin domain-containing protein [Candidatus Ancillula sp.]|jgi:hypothetical protein|nr:type IV toxin-antitoxin system AbiEi family antitoxin domain-containing protein [Candidatus Ancillula sp.]